MEIAYSPGLSAAAALALGAPLRLFGWRATWSAIGRVRRTLRGYRWRILLILLAGAAFGLWRLDDVRALIFGLF